MNRTAVRKVCFSALMTVSLLLIQPVLLINHEGTESLVSMEELEDSRPEWRSLRPRRQCPACQPPSGSVSDSEKMLADSARLESIKRQILVKLGLQTKPNITGSLPKDFVLETLIRAEGSLDPNTFPSGRNLPEADADPEAETATSLDGVEDDFYGRTSEIIAFAEQGPMLNDQVLLEFSHSQETEPNLRVKSAVLWVHVTVKGSPRNLRRLSHDKKPTLFVFRALSKRNKTQNWDLEMLSSDRVTLTQSGWRKINITDGVQKWFSTSNNDGQLNKLRLLIDCSGCGATVEPTLLGSSGSESHKPGSGQNRRRRRYSTRSAKRHAASRNQVGRLPDSGSQNRPFLVIQTDSISSRRLKRRVLDCSPTTRACCKQRFFVSFRALGWDDWIIAPSGYYANYCRGDCGGAHRTPDTFLNYHTHVLEEFRRIDSFPDIQPCCAPTKFSSMSLIYFGPEMNIIKRDLPKMVVDECGCP